MVGYSGTPLAKKLGIKEGHHVALLNAPLGFAATLDELPDEVTLSSSLRASDNLDVIVFFTKSRAELLKSFAPLAARLEPAGGLWIAWPKKSSGIISDVTENEVRSIGLAAGLVDNKVCAVDDTWSGLRFVIRVKDRPKKSTRRAH